MYGNKVYHLLSIKENVKNCEDYYNSKIDLDTNPRGTKLIGILDYSFNKQLKYFYIDSIFVNTNARNLGIGKELLNRALLLAEKLHAVKIVLFLERNSKNDFTLFDWYQRNGFVPCKYFEVTRLMELDLTKEKLDLTKIEYKIAS
jgi:ribosomal protein S18 acetylase RimI-like enzyme